jgi:hypothetical protein
MVNDKSTLSGSISDGNAWKRAGGMMMMTLAFSVQW